MAVKYAKRSRVGAFLPATPSLKITENPENCAATRAIKKVGASASP
jgi:hypothetical protein